MKVEMNYNNTVSPSGAKLYRYIQPLDSTGEVEYVDLTSDQILLDYWETWSRKMIDKYGPDDALLTAENCIQDWVHIHWAWEVRP